MLICWRGGGQKRHNRFPHNTSDLVRACYCFWRRSWASAGSAARWGLAFASTSLPAGCCLVLSSACPRCRLGNQQASVHHAAIRGSHPTALEDCWQKMDSLGSICPALACLGSSVCIRGSTLHYGAHCRSTPRWSAHPPVSHLASRQGKLLQEAPGCKRKGRSMYEQQPSFIWTSHAPSSHPP